MSDSNFSNTFNIGKHVCTLIQHGDGYELRVDNQSFNHVMDLGIIFLHNIEKNKLYFGSESKGPTCINMVGNENNLKSNKPKFGFGINNVSNVVKK